LNTSKNRVKSLLGWHPAGSKDSGAVQ